MGQATNFFLNMDSWRSGLIFLVLLFLGWLVGMWINHRHGAPSSKGAIHVEDAGLALFGLVLAFWFSGAAARFQQRKVLLREDAIAIGEFSTVSTALNDPIRSEINTELIAYVNERLRFGKMSMADPHLQDVVGATRNGQTRLWTMVEQALETKNTPGVHVPLINAYNGMVAASDERLYGTLDHVPETIIVMLIVLGVFTTFTMGRLHDPDERTGASFLRVGAYIVLVTLVFTVTLDLEQPRGGIMQVSQAPMRDLLHTLSSRTETATSPAASATPPAASASSPAAQPRRAAPPSTSPAAGRAASDGMTNP